MKKIIIAIDGYSSTGKSTLAKQIAQKLHYAYIDSGAMYRAITWFALKEKWIGEDNFNKEKLITHLPQIQLDFRFDSDLGFAPIYLNDENIENQIRSIEVSSWVSQIAKEPEIRQFLVKTQREMGKNKALVMDGRDIGTVVFPQAEVKLFMTATEAIRAQRRFEELKQKSDKITFSEVLENITQRDFVDTTREDSPLVKADDALVIDNSELSKEEQFELVMNYITSKINANN